MQLNLLLLLPFFLLGSALADEVEIGLDYSKSPDSLVIKGRGIPVKFGAAFVGFKTQLTPESTIAFKFGRGYDPSVKRTFLDVDSSGPASCDIVAVEAEKLITSADSIAISSGVGYKYQKVHANLNGNRNGGPFTGTSDITASWVDAYLKLNYKVSDSTVVYGRGGAQAWRFNFDAFGSKDRTRVWTDSAEKGVSPSLAFGISHRIGETTFTTEASAYSLRSDNKIWMPGFIFKAVRVW